jgi:hypothetical protein
LFLPSTGLKDFRSVLRILGEEARIRGPMGEAGFLLKASLVNLFFMLWKIVIFLKCGLRLSDDNVSSILCVARWARDRKVSGSKPGLDS